MSKIQVLAIFAAPFFLVSLLGLASGKDQYLYIEGQVYCDTCRLGFPTRASEWIEGDYIHFSHSQFHTLTWYHYFSSVFLCSFVSKCHVKIMKHQPQMVCRCKSEDRVHWPRHKRNQAEHRGRHELHRLVPDCSCRGSWRRELRGEAGGKPHEGLRWPQPWRRLLQNSHHPKCWHCHRWPSDKSYWIRHQKPFASLWRSSQGVRSGLMWSLAANCCSSSNLNKFGLENSLHSIQMLHKLLYVSDGVWPTILFILYISVVWLLLFSFLQRLYFQIRATNKNTVFDIWHN